MGRNLSDDIESLCERRAAAWATGDAETATRCTKQLDALYEEKRRGRASHGSKRARERAIQRAVAERELDRLMTS